MIDRIRVEYWRKPIPTNAFDYIASYADDEPNENGSLQTGSGATAADAVLDLIDTHPRGIDCCER